MKKVKVLGKKIEAERQKKCTSSEKRKLLLKSFKNPLQDRLNRVDQQRKAKQVLWFEGQKL